MYWPATYDLAYFLWTRREDLQKVFTINDKNFSKNLNNWYETYGVYELNLDLFFKQESKRIASKNEIKEKPLKKGVNIFFFSDKSFGLGSYASIIIKILTESGYHLNFLKNL